MTGNLLLSQNGPLQIMSVIPNCRAKADFMFLFFLCLSYASSLASALTPLCSRSNHLRHSRWKTLKDGHKHPNNRVTAKHVGVEDETKYYCFLVENMFLRSFLQNPCNYSYIKAKKKRKTFPCFILGPLYKK